MLKRYKPSQPNGTTTTFSLPDQYLAGPITLFINGQLLVTQNDTEHPFGYTLDEVNKEFTFYTPPLLGDFLYILYDSDGSGEDATDFSGSGLMKLQKGYNLISYQGAHQANWDKDSNVIVYNENVLANVYNLIIDQVESVYGVDAGDIIREIQTYDTDTGKYRTYKTGATSPAWCGDGEHVTNDTLWRPEEEFEYGDPDDNNYVVYNPGNFLLSNCVMDAEFNLISLDADNNIADLPAGLRTGIHIFIYEDADLSLTNDLLEIWF